ncbi:hypothetical protein ACFQX7_09625 [Luedemannella flava]
MADPAKELTTVRSFGQGAAEVVRFQQTYGGLPVIGGQLAVTVNSAGGLLAINGEAGATGAPPRRRPSPRRTRRSTPSPPPPAS